MESIEPKLSNLTIGLCWLRLLSEGGADDGDGEGKIPFSFATTDGSTFGKMPLQLTDVCVSSNLARFATGGW